MKKTMHRHTAAMLLLGLALGMPACNETGSGTADGKTSAFAMEPAFETDQSTLDASLDCNPFEHPDKPPVLLVHGTFITGPEQYDWSYKPLLEELGFDVCLVTYPDRGLGDIQISAEYVVNALRHIHAESGRKVAMIGHSQGGLMPRWALKWWPSARDAVADFVMHGAPNHGIILAGDNPITAVFSPTTGIPAGFRQMGLDSNFETVLNSGDETPGEVEYTSIYTRYDELIQPVEPVPTAALDWGMDNPRMSNILLQDVCPELLVDHVSIGISDLTTFLLTLDAILNPGPANVERAGGPETLCAPVSPVPGFNLPQDFPLRMAMLVPASFQQGFFDFHLTQEEPPIKPYARDEVQP